MKNGKHAAPGGVKRPVLIVVSVLLILTIAVGGTLAWLTANTESKVNTFTPSKVDCEVTENFDGTVKSNVNVKNTGDTEAYLRVRLVAYRTNDNGQHIGGTASVPQFTPGTGWVKNGEYYYYTQAVDAGKSPTVALIDSITLTAFSDADGGYLSIDVMAEAIQRSGPSDTYTAAWDLTAPAE